MYNDKENTGNEHRIIFVGKKVEKVDVPSIIKIHQGLRQSNNLKR
jgi:hypothetical protein